MSEPEGPRRVPKNAGARAVSLAIATVLIVMAVVLGSLVFGTAPARAYTPFPVGTGSITIEPNPMIEGNVTFSSHGTGTGPLQYTTSAGGQANLTAVIDPRVTTGDFVIAPNGIIAPGVLQQDKVAGTAWNATGYWNAFSTAHGSVAGSVTQSTVNGVQVISDTLNGTGASSQTSRLFSQAVIAASTYPSATLTFDWFTFILGMGGPSCSGGASNCYLTLELAPNGGSNAYGCVWNSGNGTLTGSSSSNSCASGSTLFKIYSGTTAIVSVSMAQLSDTGASGFAVSAQPNIWMTLPAASSTAYTATIYGMALTTAPLTLGTSSNATATGAGIVRNTYTTTLTSGVAANANLTGLNPDFTYTTIAGGTYTVAIVQRAGDLGAGATTSYASEAVANATAGGPGYVERVTYDFNFGFSTAPSLIFGSFKLMDRVNISGAQYITVTFGGTSYTTAYHGYSSCGGSPVVCTGAGAWQTVQGSVTPTTAVAWIGVIDYTGGQWDSISAPPGIFSSNGIQYYWFVFLGLIVAAVGGSSAWVTTNQRALRARRGVGRVPFAGLVDRWERRKANLRSDRRGEMHGRHLAAIVLGLVLAGGGAVAIWAIFDGADTVGASAAFVGGLIIMAAIAAIGFVAYEIMYHARLRRHHTG